ncbi:MAG: protein kinase [Aliishimia sp.]
MAELSSASLTFLQKHLNYDARGLIAKKRLRSQMEKFARRRDKAQSELDILPPDHARRKEFTDGIAAAVKTAENGDLTAAYGALDAIKLASRAEANTVKNGLSANTVLADLVPMLTKAQSVADSGRAINFDIHSKASFLEVLVESVAIAAKGVDRNDIITRAGNAMRAKTDFQGRLNKLKADAEQGAKDFKDVFVSAPDTKPTLARLEHNAKLLRDQGSMTQAMEVKLATINQHVVEQKMLGGAHVFSNEFIGRAGRCIEKVNAHLDVAKATPKMEMFRDTDKEGNPLSEDEASVSVSQLKATDTGLALVSIFADLEEREAKLIEDAKERMRAEANFDRYMVIHPEDAAAIVPSRVEHFETTDVLSDDNFAYDPLEVSISADRYATDAANIMEGMLTMSAEAYLNPDIGSPGKVPDQLLEVASRTHEGWCEEVAASLGFGWAPDFLSKPLLEKIEAAATALRAKALETYPDKAAADFSSFTMGGEVFSDIKQLGKGGGGVVYLATSEAGRSVVIKKPTNLVEADEGADFSADIEDMRTEIMTQRAVTGGEDGVCSEHLMEHLGMVMSAEGVPLPVMDLADAGDAEEFSAAMAGLSETGLMSEGARQALMAAQMRDVLKGVKAMHDQGYAHFDLKKLNVFMMKDGSFKVADFGLAQETETQEQKLEDMFETTPLYKAPEVDGASDLTMKADLFSLGAMLQQSVDPTQGWAKATEEFSRHEAGPSAANESDGGAITGTASNRLVEGLMSEDASERPSIETALQMSYFDDIERGYDPAALDRLRKATAEYSATIGRKTKVSDGEIAFQAGKIARLQRKLDGADARDMIKNSELFIERTKDQIERKKQAKAAMPDAMDTSEIDRLIKGQEDDLAYMVTKLAERKNNPDSALTESAITRIERDLKNAEHELAKHRKIVSDIRNDEKYADILAELKEASGPFR